MISGIGEIDMKEEVLSSRIPPVYHMPVPPPPYLLLDVRDKEDYEQSHIITGKHNNKQIGGEEFLVYSGTSLLSTSVIRLL